MTRPSTPLWTRPGSSSGLPGYSAEPPSYSGTPNQRTPTGPQNNGPSARLLSSMDDTEYRPYVQPLQSHIPKRPSPSYRRQESLRRGNGLREESCDDHGKRPVNKDDADPTLSLSSASSPTSSKPRPSRKPVPKARFSAGPNAMASPKSSPSQGETSCHSGLPVKDPKATASSPEAIPKEETPKKSTTLKVHFKNPSSSVKCSSPISPRRSIPSCVIGPPLQYLDRNRHQSSTLLQSLLRRLQIRLLTYLTYQQEAHLRDPFAVSPGRRLTHRDLLLQTYLTKPASINGSPRPGTPSSRYSSSPKRPLPPAPLFAGNSAASNSLS